MWHPTADGIGNHRGSVGANFRAATDLTRAVEKKRRDGARRPPSGQLNLEHISGSFSSSYSEESLTRTILEEESNSKGRLRGRGSISDYWPGR